MRGSITSLIYCGYSAPEAYWLRVAVGSFFASNNAPLLVVDNTGPDDPLDTLTWLRDQPRVILTRSLATPGEDGRREHGDGYDAALGWCRATGVDFLISLECDCEISTDLWRLDLLGAMTAGVDMAGSCRLDYGPLHHMPACYRVAAEWPSFCRAPKNGEPNSADYPRVFDDAALQAAVAGYARGDQYLAHLTWFRQTWDTGQLAWYRSAIAGRTAHVDAPGITHHWHGATRSPSPEVFARWV